MRKKRGFITGISGQIGSYLADLLLEKGYEVHGIIRTGDQEKLWRLRDAAAHIEMHEGDLRDERSVNTIIKQVCPDEVYHLAATTVSKIDFSEEKAIFENNFNPVLFLLQAIKRHCPDAKFFFAASAMMYGTHPPAPQDEATPFRPATPYAIAKSAGFFLVKMYREAHGIFAGSGILFNNESPRRDPLFVTRKISIAATRIKLGLQQELVLGNLDTERDWEFAGDCAEAMWLMLQAKTADDFVIGSGVKHTVQDFVETAFGHLGLNYKKYVRIDPTIIGRGPSSLVANPAKAANVLGWKPNIGFEKLVQMMVNSDLEEVKTRQAQ